MMGKDMVCMPQTENEGIGWEAASLKKECELKQLDDLWQTLRLSFFSMNFFFVA